MTEPVVHLVSKGNRASRLRRELHRAIGVIVDEHGEDLGGYALVAWDMRGQALTVVNAKQGPISEDLAPSYAGHALNRHVTMLMTETHSIKTL